MVQDGTGVVFYLTSSQVQELRACKQVQHMRAPRLAAEEAAPEWLSSVEERPSEEDSALRRLLLSCRQTCGGRSPRGRPPRWSSTEPG